MSPAVPILRRETSVLHKALSLPVIVGGLLVCVTFCFCCFRFNDPDMWWHLKLGQEIWTSHQIPRSDHWSFTVFGNSWIAHEWLSQVFIYLAYAAGGYAGLQFWLCGMASTIVGATYVLCNRSCGDPTVAAVGGFLALFFGTIGFAVRPQCVGYLLLVIELLILERAWSRRPGILWALPALFAVWVNCHGSYVLGLGIFIAAVVCSSWQLCNRKADGGPGIGLMIQVVASCVLALFVNPVGVGILEYPFNVFLKQHVGVDWVEEWLPLTVLDPRGIGVVVVLGVMLIAGLTGLARASRFELLVLLPVSCLTLRHTRMAFVFGIIAAPITCRMLARARKWVAPRPDHLPTSAFLLTVSAWCCYAAFPSTRAIQENIEARNPVKAVQFIRQARLDGPMLHASRWGGYLIWAMPEHKVFVDGRADVFDWAGVLGKFRDWATVQADPVGLLDEYRIHFCLLQASEPMAYVMPHLSGWREIYRDELAVVFERVPGDAPGR